jgi:hypothetical protein
MLEFVILTTDGKSFKTAAYDINDALQTFILNKHKTTLSGEDYVNYTRNDILSIRADRGV